MSLFELMKRLPLQAAMVVLLCSCGAADDMSSGGAATAVSPEKPMPRKTSPASAPASAPRETPAVSNSREMLASIGQEERKLTESFYAEFGRQAMEFENSAELAWMTRRGYPLPSDIVESNRLTDAELQARLDAGDTKAGLFLLDRMAKRANGVSSLEAGHLAERLMDAGGPFAGYAYYRYFREVRGRWADALAGLLWAFQQGDWRAEELFSREMKTGGQFGETLEVGDIAMAYVALIARMDSRNPASRGRRVDPLIIYRSDRK